MQNFSHVDISIQYHLTKSSKLPSKISFPKLDNDLANDINRVYN